MMSQNTKDIDSELWEILFDYAGKLRPDYELNHNGALVNAIQAISSKYISREKVKEAIPNQLAWDEYTDNTDTDRCNYKRGYNQAIDELRNKLLGEK